MKIVTYARASSEKQVEAGNTLPSQQERLAAWAGLLGHQVVAHVEDAGVSGSVKPDERDGFRSAISILRSGKAEGIAAVALDRFSRSTVDVLTLASSFGKQGWALLSMRESIDPSTATGELILTVLAAFSQFERKIIGERTAAALQKRKIRGERHSRFAPWGYANGDGPELIPVAVERSISDRVVALRAEGKTAGDIRTVLNTEFGPHPRTQKPWSRGMVETLVRSIRRNGQKAAKARVA